MCQHNTDLPSSHLALRLDAAWQAGNSSIYLTHMRLGHGRQELHSIDGCEKVDVWHILSSLQSAISSLIMLMLLSLSLIFHPFVNLLSVSLIPAHRLTFLVRISRPTWWLMRDFQDIFFFSLCEQRIMTSCNLVLVRSWRFIPNRHFINLKIMFSRSSRCRQDNQARRTRLFSTGWWKRLNEPCRASDDVWISCLRSYFTFYDFSRPARQWFILNMTRWNVISLGVSRVCHVVLCCRTQRT